MFVTVADLREKIEEDMRMTSTAYQNEAWVEAVREGIEPEIMAECAFTTALRELARIRDEAALLAMLEDLRARVLSGEFAADRTRH